MKSRTTMPHAIQSITQADVHDHAPVGASLLALNAAHETALSRLDLPRLRHLVASAFLAKRIGDAEGAVEAMLIAFDQDADYDSPNFLWFRDRLARFVYVDRIVVADAARGRGHARALYDGLFRQARAAGHDRIVCEVNQVPPNPASDAFHSALGFVEVGSAILAGGEKTVRYLECRLTT